MLGAGFSVSSRESVVGGSAMLLPTVTRGVVAHVAPSMLQTTCCIHSGCSGGAILRPSGELVALVVCNVKDDIGDKQLFPRVNMAIPFTAISDIIDAYTANGGKLRIHHHQVLEWTLGLFYFLFQTWKFFRSSNAITKVCRSCGGWRSR